MGLSRNYFDMGSFNPSPTIKARNRLQYPRRETVSDHCRAENETRQCLGGLMQFSDPTMLYTGLFCGKVWFIQTAFCCNLEYVLPFGCTQILSHRVKDLYEF